MSSRQGYSFILIILQVFLPTEVLLYKIRCPETLARHIRSRKCTSLGRHSYHCLPVNDIEYDVFKEECKTFEWITPGKYPVLSGEYIDDESCLANTYQPLLYQSDEQHTCLYQKSICSGEGLIEFDNGNTTTDRTCRCDYTKGYKFIVTPKHRCFCIPSEEDCSCFVKSCSPYYKLNADYACVTTTDGNDKEECPIIKGTDLTHTPTTIRYSTTDMIKSTDHWLKSDQIIRVAPLIVLVYAFIVLIIAPICSSGPSNQKAPICSSGPSNQKAPICSSGPSNQKALICSSGPSNQKALICSSGPSNQKALICSSGPSNQKEPQPTTYPYRLKEDSGSKKILQTGSSARTVKAFSNPDSRESITGQDKLDGNLTYQVKKEGIFILYAGTNSGDVQMLTDEIDKVVKEQKFDNPFEISTREYLPPHPLKLLLERCHVLFIYIHRGFTVEMVAEKYGFTGNELHEALSHPTVKLVLGCRDVPDNLDSYKYLNYYEYRRYDNQQFKTHLESIVKDIKRREIHWKFKDTINNV